MPGKRKYYQKDVQHIYQISSCRGLVFCSLPDYLSLFTILCVKAHKFKVRIISLTIMLNHFHIEASFESIRCMVSFMNSITSVFVRKFNKHYSLSGPLFHRPYGNSNKSRESYVFDCYIYIGNNAKVKHAVSRAEEYRWNFLKYMENPFPFSSPYIPEKASSEMKSLVRKLKKYHLNDWPIDYDFFECKEYSSLKEAERQQLVDMIISTYNVLDYSFALKRFGTPAKIYDAMNTVSGADYGSGEDSDQENYQHYYRMIKLANEEGYDMRVRRFVGVGDGSKQMPEDIAERLCRRFNSEIQPSRTELKKFFSINEWER